MLSTRLTTIAFLAAAWSLTSGAMLYDVACPGVNSELHCPEGHVIDVESIDYGVESNANCSDRKQPGLVSTLNCIQPELLDWVETVCNDLSHCHLPKPYPQMFLCNYSSDTFIQIGYHCHPRDPNMKTAIACEGNSTEISCAKGVIEIVKANFGRLDSTTCTNTSTHMTFCTSKTAEDTVEDMCEEKTSCLITANAATLGQPYACDENPKYLHVEYLCE